MVKAIRSGRRKVPWQHRRSEGNEQRWRMISQELDGSEVNLLDVGCNAGVLTRNAAQEGLISIGIDADSRAIDVAQASSRGESRIAYMLWRMQPEDLARLPQFDIILLLSVYHQWVASYGNQVALEMLATLRGKARHKLFFEPASLKSKYGDHPPSIVDNDEQSIAHHNLEVLASDSRFRVRVLGASQTPSSKEAFRLLLIAERA